MQTLNGIGLLPESQACTFCAVVIVAVAVAVRASLSRCVLQASTCLPLSSELLLSISMSGPIDAK